MYPAGSRFKSGRNRAQAISLAIIGSYAGIGQKLVSGEGLEKPHRTLEVGDSLMQRESLAILRTNPKIPTYFGSRWVGSLETAWLECAKTGTVGTPLMLQEHNNCQTNVHEPKKERPATNLPKLFVLAVDVHPVRLHNWRKYKLRNSYQGKRTSIYN